MQLTTKTNGHAVKTNGHTTKTNGHATKTNGHATGAAGNQNSALEEARQNARAVLAVVSNVSKAKTAQEAIRSALDAIRAAFTWGYGSYWMLDKEENVLRFNAESGTVNEEFRRVTLESKFAEGVGLSGRAWKARDLYFTADVGQMTDCSRAPVAQRAGVKSGVCSPSSWTAK